MKRIMMFAALAVAVCVAGSCTPKAPETKSAGTPTSAKKSLSDTVWNITLKDVKYTLEFTNDTAVVIKGGEKPEGVEGMYSIAADGALTIQAPAANLNESGTYDGKILKIAGVGAIEDISGGFQDSGVGSVASSHAQKAVDMAPVTTPLAPTAVKNDLPYTAWDFTWENAKYKRLEFTSATNVTLMGGNAPKEGVAGTYTLADDGTFSLKAGDISEIGSYDGKVLKVADVEGKKDQFSEFAMDPVPTGGSSSRR